MEQKYRILSLILICIIFITSCQKDTETVILRNDCIKRSLGPNIVGLPIEFVYATALPANLGKIISVSVDASIAGDAGTYLENKSYYTNSSGSDIGITIGDASVNNLTRTTVTFNKDTCAAALRYYYIVPEEARGKSVTFTFSAEASNGGTVSYLMGPYTISNMDMKLDVIASNDNLCYISLADMAVYNAAYATENSSKIDLVYLYRNIPGISFAHALVSPAADPQYLPGVILPDGITNDTRIIKMWNLFDKHLARAQYGIYIDDVDLQEIDFTDMPNYSINMKAQSGAWVETFDGKYRAFIYVNSIDNNTKSMKISIKRLAMP